MNPLFLLLGAFCYALTFWTLASWRPRIALFLILASAPFQNDISGGGPVKFSLAEIHLLLALPVVLCAGRRIRFGPALLPALAYLAVGLLCSLSQWRPTTLTCLVQVSIYLVVVVMVFASLVRSVEDYRLALHGFVVVCSFLSLASIVARTPYIFGLHKNGLGASLATAFVIAFELWLAEPKRGRRWWYMLAALILAGGCVLTLSRGAWLAAATGVFVLLALRRQFGLMFRTVVVLAPVIALCWSLLPAGSKEYATSFDSERWNVKMRYRSMDFALEQFRSSPITGVGVGLRKEYDATNVVLLTLAETGAAGVVTFLLIHAVVASMVWKTHLVLPRRSIEFSVVAISGALILGKLVHGMVDHYWSRGSLTVVWASFGMAVAVAQAIRRRRMAPRPQFTFDATPAPLESADENQPPHPATLTPQLPCE
jgi:hypothetical protein